MKFIRRGLLIDPALYKFKDFTHAANPTVLKLNEKLIRIIYNSRDTHNRSWVLSIDFNYHNDAFSYCSGPVALMEPGELGAFDDSGVSVGSICEVDGKNCFYYMGWNLGVTVPWRNSIGLALYDVTNNKMQRIWRAPVLDRSEDDPYTLSYPYVMKVKDTYKMFYGSNRTWNTSKVDIDHILKSADSTDGIIWKNKEVVNVNFPPDANAFCRPTILIANNEYLMAYAFRGSKYKIGFLKSRDLVSWNQCGFFGPTPEVSWESEEVTYPYLFSISNKTFMVYCGNSYGKFGIGLAEIEL